MLLQIVLGEAYTEGGLCGGAGGSERQAGRQPIPVAVCGFRPGCHCGLYRAADTNSLARVDDGRFAGLGATTRRIDVFLVARQTPPQSWNGMGSHSRQSSQHFTFIRQSLGLIISLPFRSEVDRSSIGFAKILYPWRMRDNPTYVLGRAVLSSWLLAFNMRLGIGVGSRVAQRGCCYDWGADSVLCRMPAWDSGGTRLRPYRL